MRGGLSVVDPRTLSATRPTPRVTIDEVHANDQIMTGTSLPAGTAKIEIAYTAPELTYPLRTHFRYRLDGFDPDWVDAGPRRQVTIVTEEEGTEKTAEIAKIKTQMILFSAVFAVSAVSSDRSLL